jgi:hypothetical protein
MTNKNQGYRSGNAFGRLTDVDFSGDDTDKVALKPGYLVRMRDRFHLVEAMEPLSVDLWFTDSINLTHDGTDFTAGAGQGTAMNQYGHQSIQAYFDIADSAANADYYGNILKPDFDSGYLAFNDIEPFKGNLYQLCPTIPNQPKFMDKGSGEWHSISDTSPHAGGTPIGFAGGSSASNLERIGTVSAKLLIKHPAGVPRGVLDEAPEGESGPTPQTTAASGAIDGLSGFIDGQMSPLEAPNWSHSIFIEHGENNMPIFRLVNDSDEFLMDGRIRLVGWKYRVIELTKEQLQLFKQRSGGRLTFKIINTTGLPVSGAMLADYFPK